MNSPPSQDDRLIDFKETAHLLGDISERSVRRLIARGELPPPVKVLRSLAAIAADIDSRKETS